MTLWMHCVVLGAAFVAWAVWLFRHPSSEQRVPMKTWWARVAEKRCVLCAQPNRLAGRVNICPDCLPAHRAWSDRQDGEMIGVTLFFFLPAMIVYAIVLGVIYG